MASAFLLLIVVVVAFLVDRRHSQRQSAIKCVLAWGRLAPFPDDAQDFQIRVDGSMFTRSFRVSFRGNPQVIADWLSECPGIADAEQQKVGPSRTQYRIRPGEGAQGAEVEVDHDQGVVKIYVYWS